MADAEIIVMGHNTVADIHPFLFGQFIEMAGTCINGGLYDPTHLLARPDGLRADVVEGLRELRPTHIRYPGGCGATYFDWQELVGPGADRPRAKLFRTQNTAQSTAFGIPEAYALCRELGAELYLTVNAHTQSPEDAANLVEYLNSTQPTRWADLRRRHGQEEPYGVKLFGLGNEIYGNWQAGQKSADEYARWCREAILQMKRVDPSIKVVVCGLGRPNPEWDRTVLFETVGLADMISVHNYFGRPIFKDSMAAGRICDAMFNGLNALIDEAMDTALGVHPRTHRELGSPPTVPSRPQIAFDEWNVWYRSQHDPEHDLEEYFNFGDALTVASLLHVVLRNARTVGLSNISLAVNTLALMMADRRGLFKQTTWYAHKAIRDAHAAGRVVETPVSAPVFSAKHERFFCGIVDPEKARDEKLPSLLHFTDLLALDVLASIDESRKRMTLSVVQKLEDRPLTTTLTFRGVSPRTERVNVTRLVGSDLTTGNTMDQPEAVHLTTEILRVGEAFTFPPASLTVFEFDL
jgi:alpha-N-arabinofuranosidase